MTRRQRMTCLAAALVAGCAMTQTACGGPSGSARPSGSYDAEVLADSPALYLPLGAGGARERSVGAAGVTSHHAPGVTTLPDGDRATLFDGTSQYVEVPDADRLSVTATGELTMEAWMRPDTLAFPRTAGTGYVNWLGKVSAGGVSAEWLARMYSRGNTEVRANRVSGYVFNRGGGLGAGSYFEDRVRSGEWIHFALVVNTREKSATYPTGYVKVYKNGVLRDQDSLDAYDITPSNTDAPMRIGTADTKSFFKGAIGKVAVYDSEVRSSRLADHYRAMKANAGEAVDRT
ncbi:MULTISPECIES: LamG domain-containing protein [unclassified Streptomyces]|uniref:LamG domain-containing protein n=1 Tax=unclassified Streptomyces TaxID=2593676 RepID=UPI00341E13D2